VELLQKEYRCFFNKCYDKPMVAYAVNNIFALSANLAQLVEHFIRNERVACSIQVVGSSSLLITPSEKLFS
jgi:hypothetical protein